MGGCWFSFLLSRAGAPILDRLVLDRVCPDCSIINIIGGDVGRHGDDMFSLACLPPPLGIKPPPRPEAICASPPTPWRDPASNHELTRMLRRDLDQSDTDTCHGFCSLLFISSARLGSGSFAIILKLCAPNKVCLFTLNTLYCFNKQ